MSNKNEESLKGLFEKFFDPAEAEKMTEDICRGEEILRRHPAPRPADALIADIKAKVSQAALRQRKINLYRKLAYRMVTAAAVIIVLVSITTKLAEKNKPEKSVTASASSKMIWDDKDLTTLTTEIEQAEEDILALNTDQNGNGYKETELTELEINVTEISSNFWKG
jgi:hypothetical protein